MKERPILFSGPMVRSILAGEKTQTRRVVKPQPPYEGIRLNGPESYHPAVAKNGFLTPGEPVFGIYDDEGEYGCVCPYGSPGDRLWVRESWGAVCDINKDGPPDRFHLNYDDVAPKEGMRWYADYIIYAADPEPWEWYDDDGGFTEKSFWKPSIHMPRWASRINLEVTGVRVERLQDISEEDAKAEGASPFDGDGRGMPSSERHVAAFCELWESINGPKSWAANPWVWVVEFRKEGA